MERESELQLDFALATTVQALPGTFNTKKHG
jgi:hypothetical protein